MKVMVIVKATPGSEAGEMPSTELLAAMGKYNEELVNAGIMLAGEGLHPSSAGARVRFAGANRTVMDGPFTETKELIAGYWLWKVGSMQEAIDWVRKCPNPMQEDSEIEIRRVFEAEDFGEEFTPELREQEAVIRAQTAGLAAPQFVTASARKVAGTLRRYTCETRVQIPQQWEQFVPISGSIAGRVGTDHFGVCCRATSDGAFDYITGVQVAADAATPVQLQTVDLPQGRYAVFPHTRHVSAIPETIDAIWSKWAPDCGLKLDHTAPCFERYTSDFDDATGLGGMEIWIPLMTP
ncbi:MAG: GyrI-like domain-containing protein [Planctomycetaceae bacterium]|nr:GyrI-like domain-containing protein [Planctomycetaceae bacterium]